MITAISPRRFGVGRRLLVASIGVSTLNYAACRDDFATVVANLMAPPITEPDQVRGTASAGAQGSSSAFSGKRGAAQAADETDGGVESAPGTSR